MDEQLEVTFEGREMESQPEAPVSPGSEAGAAEEKAEEAVRTEIGRESGLPAENSAEEREAASETGDGSLSQAKDETGVPSPVLRAETAAPRDHYAEWQELAEAHPEVVGKELPEDIYQACMQSELPPLRVYESMMLQKQAEQISALQQEVATLRQNAENTARAPVSASTDSPDLKPEDLFLQGFNSY